MPIFKAIKNILDKGDDLDYRGSHVAPDSSYGAPLHDLTEMIPEDVYGPAGQRLYGIGDPTVDREAFNALRRARGNPDLDVPVFRAVPEGVEEMNVGDWVSTSREYAKMHGENALGGKYDVLEASVPAKKLYSEGYPYEFGITRAMLPPAVTTAAGVLGALTPDDVMAESFAEPVEPVSAGQYTGGLLNALMEAFGPDIRGNIGDGTLYGNEYQ